MARPKILIIYTGGTIGMIQNPTTGSLQPFDFTHLIDNVPKIEKLDYEINNIQFHPPIDSSNMMPDRWVEIATSIEDNYANYDGFVVLHGTDTMAYTASALSFMLENLHKPVIITGDMNVAKEEIDLKNPKSNRGNAGFSDQERDKMRELLASGFVDSFRYLYPDLKDAYSWWSYRFKARERNAGWRIDYFLVSEGMEERIEDSKILSEQLGSDHCPVELILKS